MQAGNLFAFSPDVSKARGAAADTLTLLDSLPKIDACASEGKDPQMQGGTSGQVQLEDVRFTYPTRLEVPVLNGMSMKAERGSYVAIAGPSGSGKSTM